MRLFNVGLVDWVMVTFGIGDDILIEFKMVSWFIVLVQSQVEG